MPNWNFTPIQLTMELHVEPQHSDDATRRHVEETIHRVFEERGWRVAALSMSLGETFKSEDG